MMDLDEAFSEGPVGALEVESACHAVETMDRDGVLPQSRVAFPPDGNVDLLSSFGTRFRAAHYLVRGNWHARLKCQNEHLKLFIGPFLPLLMNAQKDLLSDDG